MNSEQEQQLRRSHLRDFAVQERGDVSSTPAQCAGLSRDFTERAEQQAAIRLRKLKQLAEFSMMLAGDPPAVFKRVVRMIGELFDVPVVCLSQINGTELLFRAVYVDGDVRDEAGTCPLSITPCSLVEQGGAIRTFDSVQELFPQAMFLRDHDAYSYCGLPALNSDGRVVAVVCLLDNKPHEFTEEDQSILRVIGQRIATEIERGGIIEERRLTEAALRESEERYRRIVDTAEEGVLTIDPQEKTTFVNPKMAQMLGYTVEEMIGKALYDFMDAAARAEAIKHVKRRKQGIAEQFDFRLRRKDGSELWMHVSTNPVYDANGVYTGALAMMTDITERKQAAVEREKLDRKIRETQKLESFGVLAGGIAHDFNNLLTTILGNASIAAMELPPGSTAIICIEQITEATRNAADLCKQMLAYSGRGHFVIQKLDLGQLVEDTAQILQISISKKVVLRFHQQQDMLPIEADATQIRQVIMNLVINASDAIGDRTGVIRISTGLARVDRTYLSGTLMDTNPPEGEYVYLEVSDTGCGMSSETQAKIFDPFFTTKFTGRGLGLAAVLGILRGHKGAMKVTSEPGRGTTFKLLFPAASVKREHPVAAAAALVTHQWRGEGAVLVVDDEEPVRKLVCNMMEVMGFTVLSASDGQKCVEIFRAEGNRIRLVLLDMTMPHLDGEETFRELRRLQHDVKVILSSGYSQQSITSQFAGRGLAGFIQKPFRFEELAQAVRSALGTGPIKERTSKLVGSFAGHE